MEIPQAKLTLAFSFMTIGSGSTPFVAESLKPSSSPELDNFKKSLSSLMIFTKSGSSKKSLNDLIHLHYQKNFIWIYFTKT